MNLETHITFDDVLLVPQYSNIKSRSEVTLSSDMSEGLELRIPVIASPMDTICEGPMASSIDEFGGLGIVHRYNTIQRQTSIIAEALKSGTSNIGAAVGISGDYLERSAALAEAGANVLCLDVAHGDHVLMHVAVHNLRDKFGAKIHLMAGNVATYTGALALAHLGVDSIRVGIGGGSICSTRIQTGHGVPTLASVIECVRVKEKFPNVKIIADGGIKTSGDIVKALAAGADFVMVGSLLAGTTETPGEVIYKDGEKYKTYRGMASKDAQMDWRGKTSSLEGVTTVVPYIGPVFPILERLEGGIRSGLSYSGARNLTELRQNACFIRQTQSGLAESNTHIMWRA